MKFLLVFALLLGGCGSFASDSVDIQGVKGYAACVTGHGPPLTGAGHLARAKVDAEFKGTITITPECGIVITSE